MQLGYFNERAREYVITNPHTPVKWINYIGTRQFGGFVDHTGGALICKDDPAHNRITKYIQQMPASDFKGETLYLRLHTPSGYRLFCFNHIHFLLHFVVGFLDLKRRKKYLTLANDRNN